MNNVRHHQININKQPEHFVNKQIFIYILPYTCTVYKLFVTTITTVVLMLIYNHLVHELDITFLVQSKSAQKSLCLIFLFR